MNDKPETELQERTRHTQEATIYRVQEDFVKGSGVFKVSKRIIDVEVDMYHITIKGNEVWCDCPGFRRQTFAPEEHKHVRAARDYVARGCPKYADYRFIGVGKNTRIRFLRQEDNND